MIPSRPTALNICSFNARSLRRKLNERAHFVDCHAINASAMSESWLGPPIPNNLLFSTIDLIWTNRPDTIDTIYVSDPVSDHCCVSAPLTFGAQPTTPDNESKRTYQLDLPDLSAADWDAVRKALISSPLLKAMQGSDDVNACWLAWKSVFVNTITRFFFFFYN